MRTIGASNALDGQLPKRKIGHQRGSHSLITNNNQSLVNMKRHSVGPGMQSARAVNLGLGRADIDSSM